MVPALQCRRDTTHSASCLQCRFRVRGRARARVSIAEAARFLKQHVAEAARSRGANSMKHSHFLNLLLFATKHAASAVVRSPRART